MNGNFRLLGILGALAVTLTVSACGGESPLATSMPNAGTSVAPAHGARADTDGPAFVEIDGEQAISKISSDRAGGEWFEDDGALVRLDESTRQFQRFGTSVTATASPLTPNQAATSIWFAAPDARAHRPHRPAHPHDSRSQVNGGRRAAGPCRRFGRLDVVHGGGKAPFGTHRSRHAQGLRISHRRQPL